ncbi:phenylacetate--CoA ligase family protein [Marinobacter caseinilyticus]|uniref:phenylacetate--CoA ligase family protein n=1 Tax=Marinobacter caseinilyticus TaxID=2692195 RepID=UPI00140BFBD5|nr:phenylacetate--CoA ligase family protein [Marinobacter caseinilyticus]
MTSAAERLYYSSPVWLQNVLVSAYGYKLFHKRYTGIYHQILRRVRESRFWTPEQIEAYQSEQLFLMAKHCRENIPYYQALFAEYGLHENDFTHTTHLTRLPVLDKETLRSKSDQFRQPGVKPYIVQHTSGSTGTPLALEVNEYTYKLAMALLVEHEEFHGVPFRARRATFAGRMVQPSDRMTPPFTRMNHAEKQKLFSSYHLNADTFPWYQRELSRFQPDELIGYPSAICDLSMHYQQSQSKPGFQPTAIVTNSETLLEWQRETIESTFGCPVYDYYGTAEYVLFASQGSDQNYHLNPVIGITELLVHDPETATGHLVATSLTNHSMPLLRYNIGDTGQGVPPGPAGTVIHKLGRVNGRVDDYIETPDGRRIGRMDHIFKGVAGIREAQVIQDRPDHCLIKIVEKNYNIKLDKELLKNNFISRTGPEIKIDIEVVKNIPRGSNGKFKSVINEVTLNEIPNSGMELNER